MQVVGPTVRAFGLCVDATLTGICEPLSHAMDMLLIPHLPDAVTKLASLFRAMPDLATSLLALTLRQPNTSNTSLLLGKHACLCVPQIESVYCSL